MCKVRTTRAKLCCVEFICAKSSRLTSLDFGAILLRDKYKEKLITRSLIWYTYTLVTNQIEYEKVDEIVTNIKITDQYN